MMQMLLIATAAPLPIEGKDINNDLLTLICKSDLEHNYKSPAETDANADIAYE
ncbi:hypothetical protein PPOP_0136 [Paenibacillus popilliae ATCC 14706]|uniref:Uncharacterized protein n=1 Tax=Paenibacillus popilliae ATCC 14706 TaxID=1212764 RepID=M9LXP6_PAEPP|nr:hypothetical protein PPOP_0136 [Paenibacillus popilliae ATCC 14706]